MKRVAGLGVLLLLLAAAVSLGGPQPKTFAEPPPVETSNPEGGGDGKEGAQPGRPSPGYAGFRQKPSRVGGGSAAAVTAAPRGRHGGEAGRRDA